MDQGTRKAIAHLLGIMELPPDLVEVNNPLRRVVVSKDLCVEFA